MAYNVEPGERRPMYAVQRHIGGEWKIVDKFQSREHATAYAVKLEDAGQKVRLLFTTDC